MLLISSSPRQFVSCLALVRVLFLLCAYGGRDISPYMLKSPSSSISAQSPASLHNKFAPVGRLASSNFVRDGASPQRVNTEPTWLLDGVLREDATRIIRPPQLGQATLIEALHTPMRISISPSRASLAPNQTLQFRAGILGNSNRAVKWLVEGHEGGDASVGTVSATGIYTAPPRPTPWPSVTITAVSAYASEFLGSAVVMIKPARLATSFRNRK
jgi:hypothetical protein